MSSKLLTRMRVRRSLVKNKVEQSKVTQTAEVKSEVGIYAPPARESIGQNSSKLTKAERKQLHRQQMLHKQKSQEEVEVPPVVETTTNEEVIAYNDTEESDTPDIQESEETVNTPNDAH